MKWFEKVNCGEVLSENPLKKNDCLSMCLKFLGIVFVIAIIGVASGNNGEKSEKNTSATTQNQTLTDEEKAQKLLDEATAKFSNGNYSNALEICDKISNEYPNTAIATNIGNFKNEQIGNYPRYTAIDLMNEYEVNVVNADEKYTDNVMVISGVVSSIGKTNGYKNLCVVLRSNSLLWGVQLNFNTSRTAEVSNIVPGSTVTALGKCTGQSGKRFLVLNGKNVMIEDCILVN